MSIEKYITDNYKRYDEREELVQDLIAKFGCIRRSVADALSRLRSAGKIPKDYLMKKDSDKSRKRRRRVRFASGVSVDQVKKEFDEEAKIEAAIAELHSAGIIIKDNDFRVELGVAHDRWKVVSRLDKFDDFKIELRGKTFRGLYWGHPDELAAVKKKIDLLD